MDLGALASAALPSFIASAVEFVEATTIIPMLVILVLFDLRATGQRARRDAASRG